MRIHKLPFFSLCFFFGSWLSRTLFFRLIDIWNLVQQSISSLLWTEDHSLASPCGSWWLWSLLYFRLVQSLFLCLELFLSILSCQLTILNDLHSSKPTFENWAALPLLSITVERHLTFDRFGLFFGLQYCILLHCFRYDLRRSTLLSLNYWYVCEVVMKEKSRKKRQSLGVTHAWTWKRSRRKRNKAKPCEIWHETTTWSPCVG